VVLAGVTIGSGVDTMNRHEDFVATGLGAEAGRRAQDRTNALLGVTLGAAVATLLLGVFADWDGPAEPAAARVLPPNAERWSLAF
jgi:hypothetical protein